MARKWTNTGKTDVYRRLKSRQFFASEPEPKAPSFEAMAVALVKAGKASPAILSASKFRNPQQESIQYDAYGFRL